jgi:hypothetical protein
MTANERQCNLYMGCMTVVLHAGQVLFKVQPGFYATCTIGCAPRTCCTALTALLLLLLLLKQVLLLLKGSDRVAHDLEQLQQLHSKHTTHQQQQQQQHQHHQQQQQQLSGGLQPQPGPSNSNSSSSRATSRQPLPAQLVLRSWSAGLQPEWQFRVFVCQHSVVAISQRDPSQHFPQLASAAAAAAGEEEDEEGSSRHSLTGIQRRLLQWHEAHIGSSFPLVSCECIV